jgi:hypothetical protein
MKNLTTLILLWLLALVPALAQTTSEVRSVGSFHALGVSTGIELHLTTGATQRVEASADTPEHLGRIKTVVRNGILEVSFDHKIGEAFGKNTFVRTLRVNVTAPPLDGLSASSGSRLVVDSPYSTNTLKLDLSSGATVRGDFTVSAMNAELSSGSVATITGSIQHLEVSTSSGAEFKGDGLRAKACDAEASSGGGIAVAVQESLKANASSGGDVRYTGSPQVTKHTSSGGSVRGR